MRNLNEQKLKSSRDVTYTVLYYPQPRAGVYKPCPSVLSQFDKYPTLLYICSSIIPYTTKYLLAKIFTKGSCYVLGQKFRQNLISPIVQVTFQEVVGGAQLLVYAYMHVRSQLCVKTLTVQKKFAEKNFANSMHW